MQDAQQVGSSGLRTSSVLGSGSSSSGRINIDTSNLAAQVHSLLKSSTDSQFTDLEGFWKYLDDNKIGGFGTIADRRTFQALISAASAQGKLNYQRFSEIWQKRVQKVIINNNTAVEKSTGDRVTLITNPTGATFADRYKDNPSVLMLTIKEFEFDNIQESYQLLVDGKDPIGMFNSETFEECNKLNTYFLPVGNQGSSGSMWKFRIQVLDNLRNVLCDKEINLVTNSSVLQVKSPGGEYLFQIHFNKERGSNLPLVVDGLVNTKFRELPVYRQECIKKLYELVSPFPSLINQQIANVVVYQHPDSSVRDFWDKKMTGGGGRSQFGLDPITAADYSRLESKVESLKESLYMQALLVVSYILLSLLGLQLGYPVRQTKENLADLSSRPPTRATNFPDVVCF